MCVYPRCLVGYLECHVIMADRQGVPSDQMRGLHLGAPMFVPDVHAQPYFPQNANLYGSAQMYGGGGGPGGYMGGE